MGDLVSAVQAYQQAIQINPDHADAYFHLGAVRHQLNQLQQAVQDLRMAAKLYLAQEQMIAYQRARDLCRQVYGYREDASPEFTSAAETTELTIAHLFA